MKIIIIGAGLAGLTLANTFEQAQIDYHVYEKTDELKNIGGGVLLWPHGQRYLRHLGLESIVDCYKTIIFNCTVKNAADTILFQEDLTTINDLLDGPVLPLDRSQFQQALLAKIPKHKISFGKRCQSIVGNQVIFYDGTSTEGDLVIGADGVHSTVRQCIFPKAKLIKTEHCWAGGIVSQETLPTLFKLGVTLKAALHQILIVWPLYGERFMWYNPYSANHANAWYNQLSQREFNLPIYELEPLETIKKNKVLLIGDAAHAMGPILGQGISLALEDIYLLMQCLHDDSLLEKYSVERCKRYQRFHQLEKQSAATFINQSVDDLDEFERQMRHITLVDMYQELIPLVSEQGCQQLEIPFLDNVAA